jgi:hypothetical protein
MATERINRRGFFAGAAVTVLGGGMALRSKRRVDRMQFRTSLISAARIDDSDGGALIGAGHVEAFPLPGRAHALTRLPSGNVVIVARRPGDYAAIVDPALPDKMRQVFHPVSGHRFAGHAAVHPDGTMLATSEIDAETGDGIVVIRDARTGTAPVKLCGGYRTARSSVRSRRARLVVAVGGIARAADIKGPALNIGNIESAIVELDSRSGAVLKEHRLARDLRSLSLRHMALAPDGETILFGMQDQDRSQLRPLMGRLRIGGDVDLLPLPDEDAGTLRSYIGSVTIEASGRYVAATSPKGGMIGLWSTASGRWLGGFALADACGLAADAEAGCFWATSGLGDVVQLQAGEAGWESARTGTRRPPSTITCSESEPHSAGATTWRRRPPSRLASLSR